MRTTDDMTQAAMTTWAAKDLPARLLAAQVAELLNCSVVDVAVLVTAGKLRPLGRPNPNAVKFFSAVELMNLLADREWLDDATKTIGQFWRRKNARRHGLFSENKVTGKSDASNKPLHELQATSESAERGGS
jgi:hypothetical protein